MWVGPGHSGGAAAGFEVGRDTQVRMFRAFCGVLREMARGLVSQGMTHVVMEATWVCTMPVYHALLEPGVFGRVLGAMPHVKNARAVSQTVYRTTVKGFPSPHKWGIECASRSL